MATLTRPSLLLVAGLLGTSSATAQTTNCRWVWNTWSCTATPGPPTPAPAPRAPRGNVFQGMPPLSNPADIGSAAMDGFYRGQQMRQQAERERAVEAEAEYYRFQSAAPRTAPGRESNHTEAANLEAFGGAVDKWKVCSARATRQFALTTKEPAASVIDAALGQCAGDYGNVEKALAASDLGPEGAAEVLTTMKTNFRELLMAGVFSLRAEAK